VHFVQTTVYHVIAKQAALLAKTQHTCMIEPASPGVLMARIMRVMKMLDESAKLARVIALNAKLMIDAQNAKLAST